MQIIPTGGALGSDIRGVDASLPLAPAEFAALEPTFSDAPFIEL